MHVDLNAFERFSGRTLPPVDPVDFRKVWRFARQNDDTKAVGIEAARRICSSGADVAVVIYRLKILESLIRGLASRGTASREIVLDDTVLGVAATCPMKGIGANCFPLNAPLDIEDFLERVRHARRR